MATERRVHTVQAFASAKRVENNVAPQDYRGYLISIRITRFDDSVKVETEIAVPAKAGDQDGKVFAAADVESVTTLADEDINFEVLTSAKRVVDVLIAERSAISSGRR